jgi:hypothetical protein
MGVFKIDKDFKIILNPEAVKLVPELAGLSQKELLYVICVVDYDDGPFRKKPIDERRLLTKRKYFRDTKQDPETTKVRRAMDSYKELIFDIRRETIDKYKRRILLLQKESLKDEIELKRLKDIDAAITFLTDRVNKIQHELDIEEQSEEITIKGGRKLSQIEKWQRKQKKYREFKESL